MNRLARVSSQPVVHFAAIGLAVFLFQIAFTEQEPANAELSSNAARDHLRRELEGELGRPPNAHELETAVTQWRREEVAYRAALDRGLGDSDPLVRTRLAQRFRDLQGELLVVPDPTDAQLRQWMAANPERYSPPSRYDFRHVFASAQQPNAKQRAEQWLRELQGDAGALPPGDDFAAGAQLVGVAPRRVKMWFGKAFASRLPNIALREWSLVESKLGWHVVRVESRSGSKAPPFEQIRARLVQDFQADARRRYVDDSLDELAAEYLDTP